MVIMGSGLRFGRDVNGGGYVLVETYGLSVSKKFPFYSYRD